MPPKKSATAVESAESSNPEPKPKLKAVAEKKPALTGAALAASIIKKKMGVSTITAYTGSLPHVPSGSFAIDDLIGGTLASDGKPKCPGYPRRRITEVFGAESSGKTTAALQAIAEVQRNGGSAMFLDFEHALDHSYAKAVGVSFDPKKLTLYQPESLEEGMKYIYVGIMSGIDLIVVDSVAAMLPRTELDKGADDPSTIGGQARAFSRFLPQFGIWMWKPEASKYNPLGTAIVLINQTRAQISKMGPGSDTNTSGGRALKFYAYLRLQFSKIRSEAMEKKNKFTGKTVRVPYGNHTQVKVVKSKIDAKQGQTADIFIRFGQGIDDALSLIEAGVTHKYVEKAGAWYEYLGQRYQGREGFRAALKANPSLFQELRKQVLKSAQAGVTASTSDDEDDDDLGLDGEFEDVGVAVESESEEDSSVTEEVIVDDGSSSDDGSSDD